MTKVFINYNDSNQVQQIEIFNVYIYISYE